jgi:hypothetical protein
MHVPQKKKKEDIICWAPVAHASASNPNYSGGRDQEDQDLKSAWTNNSRATLSRKNPYQKRASEWLKL